VWRLVDLFRRKGVWSSELEAERRRAAQMELEEGRRKVDELSAVLQASAPEEGAK